MDRSVQLRHYGLLLLTAVIWGGAFVAQKTGNSMGPFTFCCLRNIPAFLLLYVFIYFRDGRVRLDRGTVAAGLQCGFFLAVASMFQQVGLVDISPGKAGFVTALYLVLIPVYELVLGTGRDPKILLAALIAAAGLWLLCIPAGEGFGSIGRGEVLCILCAVFFSFQIMRIASFGSGVDPVKAAMVQFAACFLISAPFMLYFEGVRPAAVAGGLLPLLYTGLLSSGVAYTLQMVGQQGVDPAVASLIMSLESTFSVLAGWLILHSVLTARELIGCALMFAAIVLTQIGEGTRAKGEEKAMAQEPPEI